MIPAFVGELNRRRDLPTLQRGDLVNRESSIECLVPRSGQNLSPERGEGVSREAIMRPELLPR